MKTTMKQFMTRTLVVLALCVAFNSCVNAEAVFVGKKDATAKRALVDALLKAKEGSNAKEIPAADATDAEAAYDKVLKLYYKAILNGTFIVAVDTFFIALKDGGTNPIADFDLKGAKITQVQLIHLAVLYGDLLSTGTGTDADAISAADKAGHTRGLAEGITKGKADATGDGIAMKWVISSVVGAAVVCGVGGWFIRDMSVETPKPKKR